MNEHELARIEALDEQTSDLTLARLEAEACAAEMDFLITSLNKQANTEKDPTQRYYIRGALANLLEEKSQAQRQAFAFSHNFEVYESILKKSLAS